jgi:hypothetical protein
MKSTIETNHPGGTSLRPPRLTIQDAIGARRWEFSPEPHHQSVGDVLHDFVNRSQQASSDSSGRPVTYTLRNDRAGGVRLHASQPVSDLEDGEVLTLSPSVQAG